MTLLAKHRLDRSPLRERRERCRLGRRHGVAGLRRRASPERRARRGHPRVERRGHLEPIVRIAIIVDDRLAEQAGHRRPRTAVQSERCRGSGRISQREVDTDQRAGDRVGHDQVARDTVPRPHEWRGSTPTRCRRPTRRSRSSHDHASASSWRSSRRRRSDRTSTQATTLVTAAKCRTAATTTSRCHTSWYPKVFGHGSGRRRTSTGNPTV